MATVSPIIPIRIRLEQVTRTYSALNKGFSNLPRTGSIEREYNHLYKLNHSFCAHAMLVNRKVIEYIHENFEWKKMLSTEEKQQLDDIIHEKEYRDLLED